ncbi:hypothetical protein Pla123a_34020 [Posidoniimonas polymericola]|uniref:GYF domain-containing protein n=1 Tax=Posidoniimonas polymericola TaxID=2528002 RepID=A0A5C5YI84_9BACT|nr:DUF4339 domain-containing protein [Posidoniimonas polymericola]TWT74578.1 hypothetical protein Pla123a_34020 [Posidoniimonas polymericola]
MATEWYCRLMGAELGPFTSKQLLEMARSHQVTPDDSVRKGPDGEWVGAHRVKGLFEDLSASTIIMAGLPPDVQAALDRRQQEQENKQAAKKPKPSAVSWHYIGEEAKVGPLTFDELKVHGRQGLLKPNCRVWSSKSPKWRRAREVEGLEFE